MSQSFTYTSYCSKEAILEAAASGDIEKLRELNERGTNFRVTDTVSMKLYPNCCLEFTLPRVS